MKGSITVAISGGHDEHLPWKVKLPVDSTGRVTVIGCQNPAQKKFIATLLDLATEEQVKAACAAVAKDFPPTPAPPTSK